MDSNSNKKTAVTLVYIIIIVGVNSDNSQRKSNDRQLLDDEKPADINDLKNKSQDFGLPFEGFCNNAERKSCPRHSKCQKLAENAICVCANGYSKTNNGQCEETWRNKDIEACPAHSECKKEKGKTTCRCKDSFIKNATEHSEVCPNGWNTDTANGECFFKSSEKVKFQTAVNYCKEHGANLGAPLNQLENNILKNRI